MNILVVHSSSDLYGASKILLQTVAHLSRRGHKIAVALSSEGPLADLIRKEGCDVYIIKLGILRRKHFTPSGLINRMSAIRRAVHVIKRIAVDNKIDIVYSNTTTVLAGAFLVKKMNIKHIWHIHEIIPQRWLLRMIGWIVNRYSDKVIVVSNAVKKHWEGYVDEKKITVIYNGLEYEKYLVADGLRVRRELGISPGDVLIGMIGRVHPWKGQTYFLNIAKHVLEHFPNTKFIMVGDAFPGNEYLYDEIKSTKLALGINDHVIDLGYRTDIPDIVAGLDIFVLPSTLPDPLPTVVFEAMAAGKPVVATAHGGCVEMVKNNVTGFLIPWDQPTKAAEAVVALVGDKQMRERMGKNGRERVLTLFSISSYCEKIEQALCSQFVPEKIYQSPF